MTAERDFALAELEAAGILVRAGFDDVGAAVYRMTKFPEGEQGARLRALFEGHITKVSLDDSPPSR